MPAPAGPQIVDIMGGGASGRQIVDIMGRGRDGGGLQIAFGLQTPKTRSKKKRKPKREPAEQRRRRQRARQMREQAAAPETPPEQAAMLEQQAAMLEAQIAETDARLAALEQSTSQTLGGGMPPPPMPYPYGYGAPPYGGAPPMMPPGAYGAPQGPYGAAQGAPQGFPFVPVPVPQFAPPLDTSAASDPDDPLANKLGGDEAMSGEPYDYEEHIDPGSEAYARAFLPPDQPGTRELWHAMYRESFVQVVRTPYGWEGRAVVATSIDPRAPIVVSVVIPFEVARGLHAKFHQRASFLRSWVRARVSRGGAPLPERMGVDQVTQSLEDLGRDEAYRETTRRIDEVLNDPAVKAVTSAIPFVSQFADLARVASGAARGLGEGGVRGIGHGAIKGALRTTAAEGATSATFSVSAGLQGGAAAERVPPRKRAAALEFKTALVQRRPQAVRMALEVFARAQRGDPQARQAWALLQAAHRGAFRPIEVVEQVGGEPDLSNAWQAAGLYR